LKQGYKNYIESQNVKPDPGALRTAGLKVIPYYPITDENLRFITRLKLNAVAKRMRQNRNTTFTYGDDVVEAIASRCTEVDSGARNIDHIMSHTLLPEMSRELLSRMAEAKTIEEVRVTVGDEGFVYDVK